MTADELMRIIRTMEPSEIERLFVLIKEYQTEVRRRQAGTRYADPTEFARVADKVFKENKELFRMLAELEKAERKTTGP
jgi:hypothetical protein